MVYFHRQEISGDFGLVTMKMATTVIGSDLT